MAFGRGGYLLDAPARRARTPRQKAARLKITRAFPAALGRARLGLPKYQARLSVAARGRTAVRRRRDRNGRFA